METHLTLYKKDIILPKPILLSGGKIAQKSTNYFLVLEKNGIKAFGEAAPMLDGLVYKIGYGNPADIIEKDLLFLCGNLKLDFIDINSLKYLHQKFSHITSEALACFDVTIHDFISKQQDIPIYKIYTDLEPTGETIMMRTFSPQSNYYKINLPKKCKNGWTYTLFRKKSAQMIQLHHKLKSPCNRKVLLDELANSTVFFLKDIKELHSYS